MKEGLTNIQIYLYNIEMYQFEINKVDDARLIPIENKWKEIKQFFSVEIQNQLCQSRIFNSSQKAKAN